MKQLLQRFGSFLSRRATSVATAVFGVALAVTALLPGNPIMKALANTPVFNNLPDDKPALSVRVNGQGTWGTGPVNVADGEYVQFMLWAHNTEPDTVAFNTRVRAILPTADSTTHNVAGQVWADNAAAVANNVTVNLASAGKLELDPATVHTYRFVQATGDYVEVPTNSPASVVTQTGLNLGDMQGCWDYMRVVTFSARVVKQLNPDISTYKEIGLSSVQNQWSQTPITAQPGEVVAFHVYLENTGAEGSTLQLPQVEDTLDAKLAFKPGSAYMITRDANGTDVRFNIPDNQISFNGQKVTFSFSNMGSEARQAVHLYFQATLAPAASFPVGTTQVCNTAIAKGTGPAGLISKTTNQVCANVVVNPTPVYNATILKVVRNISTNSLWQSDVPVAAQPGHRVQWELRVTNTGNQPTDLIVRDILPQYVTRNGSLLIKGAAQADTAFTAVAEQQLFATGGFTKTAVQPGNVNGFVLRYDTLVNTSIPAGQQLLTNTGRVFIGASQKAQATAQILVGATSDFVLDKKVLDPADGQWKDSTATTIHPNDRVRYRIDIINTGNTELSVASIRDVLPQYLRYIDNTLVIDTHIVAGGSPVSTDDAFFSTTGITGFRLLPGVTKRFEFEAAAVACPALGTWDQVNTAFIQAAGTSANDSATIRLTVIKPNLNF